MMIVRKVRWHAQYDDSGAFDRAKSRCISSVEHEMDESAALHRMVDLSVARPSAKIAEVGTRLLLVRDENDFVEQVDEWCVQGEYEEVRLTAGLFPDEQRRSLGRYYGLHRTASEVCAREILLLRAFDMADERSVHFIVERSRWSLIRIDDLIAALQLKKECPDVRLAELLG